jgi:hypothetical protein
MPLKKAREMYPNMKTLGVNPANFRKVGKEEAKKMKKEMDDMIRRQKITGAIKDDNFKKRKKPTKQPQERDQLKRLVDSFSKRIPFL